MPPLIEIRNISKEFQGKAALRSLSLSIESEEIFGIIGLSGAGKSTLIRLLSSLERPSCGSICFQGKEISSAQGSELRAFRRKIGMVFQHFHLLSSRTVAENISYPLEIDGDSKEKCEKRVTELLKLVGLENKKNIYPSQLSGGEKQRVGIARALAHSPQVLFCDEATSALDPRTTREILALLKRLNEKLGVTIVLITHEMEVIKEICHKVAVLEKGEIVESGTVAEVFTDPQHAITKQLLQSRGHEIPEHFLKESSPGRKLLRLCFKGAKAEEPVIAHLVKQFDISANILLGWIDCLQTITVGNLVIELLGTPEKIEAALGYLEQNSIQYEVIR